MVTNKTIEIPDLVESVGREGARNKYCLLYTSDAADDCWSV